MKYKGESITANKIKSFIQGHSLYQLDKRFNILSEHKKEQVFYRMFLCKDTCLKEGKCKSCGCDTPERFYIDKEYETRQCIFPDFMGKDIWEQFKKINQIDVNNIISEIS